MTIEVGALILAVVDCLGVLAIALVLVRKINALKVALDARIDQGHVAAAQDTAHLEAAYQAAVATLRSELAERLDALQASAAQDTVDQRAVLDHEVERLDRGLHEHAALLAKVCLAPAAPTPVAQAHTPQQGAQEVAHVPILNRVDLDGTRHWSCRSCYLLLGTSPPDTDSDQLTPYVAAPAT
jgi:hypothetical protein